MSTRARQNSATDQQRVLRPGREQRVLLTGFEPFGGDSINPSALLAQALHGARLTSTPTHRRESVTAVIQSRVLPCAFDQALRALFDAISDVQPSMILATGLAAGRSDLSFERVAINLVDARIADNLGHQPIDECVLPTRRNAYFSNLPVKVMVQAALQAGAASSLSLSAGTYVCNAVFFALMHRVHQDQQQDRQRNRQQGQQQGQRSALRPAATVRGGFMHLPLLPEQVAASAHRHAPTMPLPTMVAGVTAALQAALGVRHDLRTAGGSVA
jgi:pyroglutamyl-peptidase